MKNKTKILIFGIGGVGGYFGGLLAKKYAENEAIEIYFVARGEHLQKMKTQGLTIIKGEESFIVKPTLSTDNPAEIGIVDYIFICTKSYDLAESVALLKPCISENTVLLPFLNGVNNVEICQKILPNAVILEGCVYIVARIKEAGVVENLGNIQKMFFGKKGFQREKLAALEKLLQAANIDATLAENIETIIWEKFIFISPTASATSYFDCSIGQLLDNEERSDILANLIKEASLIALAKGIEIDAEILDKTWQKLQALPYQNTSSMHNDYKMKKPHTEIESLTGYVVRAGKELGVETPFFEKIYATLKREK